MPAEFGLHPGSFLGNIPVVMQATVRTGGDYGITILTPNVTEQDSLFAATLTFWGVPADPSHNGCGATASMRVSRQAAPR